MHGLTLPQWKLIHSLQNFLPLKIYLNLYFLQISLQISNKNYIASLYLSPLGDFLWKPPTPPPFLGWKKISPPARRQLPRQPGRFGAIPGPFRLARGAAAQCCGAGLLEGCQVPKNGASKGRWDFRGKWQQPIFWEVSTISFNKQFSLHVFFAVEGEVVDIGCSF